MKKCFVFLLSIICVISLSACVFNDAGGKTVKINGVSYSFPMRGSELYKNGIGFPEAYSDKFFEEMIEPKKRTGFWTNADLVDGNNNTMEFGYVYNDSDKKKSINDCYIMDLEVSADSITDKDFIVFPGNITFNSTYDDVISAYGGPGDNNTKFESASESTGEKTKTLFYQNNKSGESFEFDFDKESPNTMKRAKIEYSDENNLIKNK